MAKTKVKNLRTLVEESGKSPRELAEAWGLSRTHYYDFVAGRRATMKWRFAGMAEAIGVSHERFKAAAKKTRDDYVRRNGEKKSKRKKAAAKKSTRRNRKK